MAHEVTMPSHTSGDPRRALPSVNVLLETEPVRELIARHSRPLALDAVQQALAGLRAELRPGDAPPTDDAVLARVRERLDAVEGERIRPVINATGIILHTGLGRAVLPKCAVDALAGLDRCCNLQIDLETGLRGKRHYVTERLICKLTGAEAALVVNNNAAATLLMLAALCAGKEVVVSRGQLIEIGGSYRLPDCVHQSGARLVEVGTTNKTHLRDYENALTEDTAAIMRVNPSNYRIVGFSKDVPVADLVTLKAKHDVLVIDDLGCGALVDLRDYGLPYEPSAPESIAAGADLCCFSGDKLIGGPQAGIIVGRSDLVQKIRKHPLTRMLRVDKLTDMALEHTLRMFLEPERLMKEHPTLRMIALPAAEMKQRAQRVVRAVARKRPDLAIEAIPGESATGGGSLPATAIPTHLVAVSLPGQSADAVARRLRKNEPPIIARIQDERVVLDMRTLLDGDEKMVIAALAAL